MPTLFTLGLNGTRITDEGLKHLSHWKILKRVYFGNTAITMNGLASVRDCPIEDICIEGTAIAEQEVEALFPATHFESAAVSNK